MQVGMDKITAFGEVFENEGHRFSKPARISAQCAADVRKYNSVVTTTSNGVKNFSSIMAPLRAVMYSDDDWQWNQPEQLAFDLLKELACASNLLHGHDPALPSEMFPEPPGTGGGGCYIRQLQPYPDKKGSRYAPLLYDAFSIHEAQRSYRTYKRELKAIVTFCEKYQHCLNGPITSTIFIDHETTRRLPHSSRRRHLCTLADHLMRTEH